MSAPTPARSGFGCKPFGGVPAEAVVSLLSVMGCLTGLNTEILDAIAMGVFTTIHALDTRIRAEQAHYQGEMADSTMSEEEKTAFKTQFDAMSDSWRRQLWGDLHHHHHHRTASVALETAIDVGISRMPKKKVKDQATTAGAELMECMAEMAEPLPVPPKADPDEDELPFENPRHDALLAAAAKYEESKTGYKKVTEPKVKSTLADVFLVLVQLCNAYSALCTSIRSDAFVARCAANGHELAFSIEAEPVRQAIVAMADRARSNLASGAKVLIAMVVHIEEIFASMLMEFAHVTRSHNPAHCGGLAALIEPLVVGARSNNAQDGQKSVGASDLPHKETPYLGSLELFTAFCDQLGAMTTATLQNCGILHPEDPCGGVAPTCHTRACVHFAILAMREGLAGLFAPDVFLAMLKPVETALANVRADAANSFTNALCRYAELQDATDKKDVQLRKDAVSRMDAHMAKLLASPGNYGAFRALVQTWTATLPAAARERATAVTVKWPPLPVGFMFNVDSNERLYEAVQKHQDVMPLALLASMVDGQIMAQPAPLAPPAPEAETVVLDVAPAPEPEPETAPAPEPEPETAPAPAPETAPAPEPMPVDEPAELAAEAAEAPRPKRKRNTAVDSPGPSRKSTRIRSKAD